MARRFSRTEARAGTSAHESLNATGVAGQLNGARNCGVSGSEFNSAGRDLNAMVDQSQPIYDHRVRGNVTKAKAEVARDINLNPFFDQRRVLANAEGVQSPNTSETPNEIFPVVIRRDDPRVLNHTGQFPNILQTFRDPYCKLFVVFWLKTTEYYASRLEAAEAKGSFGLKPAVRKRMEGQIDELKTYSYHYVDSFERRRWVKCRELAMSIQETASNYRKEVTDSISAIGTGPRPPLVLPESYEVLFQRRDLDTSLHHTDAPVIHFDETLQKEAFRTANKWVKGSRPFDQKIIWMHGPEGCGKSSLAYTVASSLREKNQLGASWVFKRHPYLPAKRLEFNQTFLVNIIIELGEVIGQDFMAAICACTEEQRSIAPSLWEGPLSHQLKMVLAPAFTKVYSSDAPPLFIVIDGIDYMEPQARKSLFDMLHSSIKLMPRIRYILAGRWNRDIEKHLRKGGKLRPYTLSVQMDIPEIPDLPTPTAEAPTTRFLSESKAIGSSASAEPRYN